MNSSLITEPSAFEALDALSETPKSLIVDYPQLSFSPQRNSPSTNGVFFTSAKMRLTTSSCSGSMLARLFSVTALLLLLGSLFATSVSALPTEDISRRSNPLEPRGSCFSRPRSPGMPPSVPSTQEIKDCATRTGKGGPNTVFYSGGVGIRQAKQLSDSKGGTYFDNFIDPTWMLDQGRGLNPTQIDIFQKRISAAMAEMSTGTTYIVLPAGSTLTPPGSTWTTIEYPLLQRSGHVTEIVRVNDGSGSGRTVVWTPANGITTPDPHVP